MMYIHAFYITEVYVFLSIFFLPWVTKAFELKLNHACSKLCCCRGATIVAADSKSVLPDCVYKRREQGMVLRTKL